MQTSRALPSMLCAVLLGCGSGMQTDDPIQTQLGIVGTPPTVGGACAFGWQCATGACSADDHPGTCGICLEVRREAQPCGGALQTCSRSSACMGGVCRTKKRPEGLACDVGPKGSDFGQCDDALFCAWNPGDALGKCTAYAPRGGACAPGLCGMQDTCEDGICVARALGRLDESCDGRDCDAGLYCESGGNMRVCRPATLPLNARCGIVEGRFVEGGCAPGTACGYDSRCVPLPQAGELCVYWHCGPGLYCYDYDYSGATQPVCLPLRQEGEACRDDYSWREDCAPGLECRAGKCGAACR